ncbi:hypothetical protein DM2_3225 [Halorubrum sp. DM2]|uniref:hypothetical protein n=1 Tax=Halorubrum sp. DM2 TaxID=2527867 RepID=UPI0024B70331|nr:hypothetical protein [Halorubrum sp. DM2]VTT87187.1 hypothetical protein DM2_3225 [Halorubrum sp. DM2]
MTASNPIPPDAFATAVESLDRDAFATLVGETYAATADAVTVDPSHVTVSSGDRRAEIRVVAAGDEPVSDDSVDTVAVASDSLLDGEAFDDAVEVVTPADLRERLLYAASPAASNEISERILGVPVRSAEYDDVATAGSMGDGATTDDEVTTDGEATTDDGGTAGSETEDGATHRDDFGPEPRSPSRAGSGGPVDAGPERPTEEVEPSSERAGATESETAGASSDRAYPRSLLAAVAVVALLAAGLGGVGVGATVGPDGLGGIAGVEGDDGGGTDSVDGDGTAAAGGDAANSVESVDGEPTDGPTDEAARNTAPAPTCERSALQVVQIQMNALRYNDDATNDGVRTLRAFASPENREVVGSVSEFAALFERERYAPMLTYDTAEYSVPEIDGGTAEIEVVTRENGRVTGRYEFRLELISGGSQGTDDALGDVDGCWMTDAVAASTE